MLVLTVWIVMPVFFVKLNPIEEGLAGNRRFLYGYMTYYQAAVLLAWIFTAFMALNKNPAIRKKAFATTLLISLLINKLLDMILCEGTRTFPIPHMSLITAFLPITLIPYWLHRYASSKTRDSVSMPRVSMLNLAIIMTICFGIWWSCLMLQLDDKSKVLQSFCAAMHGLLRRFCKVAVVAPAAMKVSPKKFAIIALSVDIIYTRIQVATIPYIADHWAFVSLVLGEITVFFVGWYGVVERVSLLIMDIRSTYPEASDVLNMEFGESLWQRFNGILRMDTSLFWQLCCKFEKAARLATEEKEWTDRALFNLVDQSGAIFMSILVRIQQQVITGAIHKLQASSYLQGRFVVSYKTMAIGQVYGWGSIVCLVWVLMLANRFCMSCFDQPDGRKVNMKNVACYLFQGHFWFYFFWLCATGALQVMAMVDHFGSDLSFQFSWLKEVGTA
jgi:hypothetical protein